MRILFRVDASAQLGGGHLVRCLALAHELRVLGAHCEFVVCPEATTAIPWFAEAGFLITCIPEHSLGSELGEASFIGRTCGKYDIAVVDHYERGSCFETAARAWANLIVVIEDIPGRYHVADVVLDPTFGRHVMEYANTVPTAEVLAGADYTLLRRSFADTRIEAIETRARRQGLISRVLVAFGASDSENYTGRALAHLMKLPEISIDVLIGSLHPQTAELTRMAKTSGGRLQLWQGCENIERLMLECDLAIGGAGGQSWERCCLGLPCLLVEMAVNQRDVAKAIVENGAGILLGAQLEALSLHLMPNMLELLEDPHKVMSLSEAAFQLCDGRGAQRAAEALLRLYGRAC